MAESLLGFIEALPLAVYELDAEGRITFTNSAYAAITGYEVDELLGMPVHELMVPGPARDATPALFRQLLAEQPDPTPILAENRTKDGRPIMVEVHWDYRRDETGEATGFVCVLSDATERARAEAELRASEERFRRMFDQAPWGAVVYTPEGRPRYINPVQRQLWGIPDEAIDEAMAHYNVLEDPQLAALGLQPLLAKGFAGEPTPLPAARYSPRDLVPPVDRDPLWIRGFVYPVLGADGEVREVVMTFEDVTEAKQVEEHRRLLDARIQQSQRMESLTVLAGGIAHDFNNLLVSILGNADLAMDDVPADSTARELLTDIAEGATRAADLVRQLLVYTGTSEATREVADLTALVRGVAQLVEASLSKKIDVRYDLAAELPPVEADATQLRQIVMNVIINAAEAIGDGPGTITIQTRAERLSARDLAETFVDDGLPDGIYTSVEVADTGHGMDRNTVERLFEPFFTTKFPGRGLGLSAVLGIVRSHQGAIRVRSDPGVGTAIQVLLPAAPGSVAEPADAEDVSRHGRGTILVVEDEEPVRRVTERMVEILGYEVVSVADGRQALEVAASDQTLHAVLLDLAMPEMDGWECFNELRRLRPGLPVVVCTGYGEQEWEEWPVEGRPEGFVAKPFRTEDLGRVLRSVVR